jgi:hypothetical protein
MPQGKCPDTPADGVSQSEAGHAAKGAADQYRD